MTEERRYREDEVAAIFEEAAAPAVARRGAHAAEGLTLADLQAIGREVGIAPERIAHAASSLDHSHTAGPRRTELGMPVSVARTTALPRALTDREWALLVTDLRETFHARGRESSQGDLRQWSNGNLHAYVEPTATGYRLRLGTVKGNALALNRMGAGGILMALVMLIVLLIGGNSTDDYVAALLLGGLGAGAFAFNALRLPRWAGEREAQMESIISRTLGMLEEGTDRPSP
jgi:hypothetical protein